MAVVSRYLAIVLIVFLFTDVKSQQINSGSNWSYGANAYYGAVFRYLREQPKLMFTGLHGAELYVQKATDGSKQWERLYNQPNIGIALSYFNYGDPEILGKVVTATSYLDFALINGQNNNLRFNVGTGFVYSTKRYDPITNPDNSAVSSKISYVLRGTIHYEMKLTENHIMNFNAGFRHFSNGKLNMPNNGMNFPIIGVGLRYASQPAPGKETPPEIENFDKKIHVNLMSSIAWREVLEIDNKHNVLTLSIYASKQVTKYNSLLLGVDGFYYEDSNLLSAIQDPFVPDDLEINGKQVAITFGNEFNLGKLWILVQGGWYVYMPAKIYSNWFQRYGFKYMINKDIFVNTNLKTHSRTANMVEFGFGVKL